LQLPPAPVLVMEKLIRVRVVSHLEVGAVPIQLVAAVSHAEGAEQHGLGQQPGKLEIGAGRRAGGAGGKHHVIRAAREVHGVGRRRYCLFGDSGRIRGNSPPQPSTSILPWSPMKMIPSSRFNSRGSSSSSGRGGMMPPSYQCNLRGGRLPRAGKS